MRPEISVVVPVYNVKPYLRKCFDSIISQSMKDIEIIVIDDGSTDGSSEICDVYSSFDERIKVIHQAHFGVSHARNVGLKQACGKYLMFVDSDDFVEVNFCKIPYEIAVNNNIDIVIFSYLTVDNNCFYFNNINFDCGLIDKQSVINNLHYPCYLGINNYLWNKLFRRSLFDGVVFPEGCNYEDVGVFFRLIHFADKIYYSDSILYTHIRREGSIVRTNSLKNRLDFLLMYYIKMVHLKKWGYIYNVPDFVFLDSLRYLVYFGYDAELSKECFSIIQSYKIRGSFSLTTNILCFLCLHNSKLFDSACKFFKKRGNLKNY